MVNLPLSKQKKDIHICKQFGVVGVIVATSLTHPTSVSMGMNMRPLEEINLVVVIINKTNNMENTMKKQKTTKCWTLIDFDNRIECDNQTSKLYDYHYAKGITVQKNIPICDDCVEKIDTDKHLSWKEKSYEGNIGILPH